MIVASLASAIGAAVIAFWIFHSLLLLAGFWAIAPGLTVHSNTPRAASVKAVPNCLMTHLHRSLVGSFRLGFYAKSYAYYSLASISVYLERRGFCG